MIKICVSASCFLFREVYDENQRNINLSISIFSQECEDKGGEKDGDCAQGYGVCCKCKS